MLCSSTCPCDVSEYQIPDSKLHNPSHCLSHLFSPKNHLRLRPGEHKYSLPICPNNLTKRSFRPRCLFCFLWSVCFVASRFMSLWICQFSWWLTLMGFSPYWYSQPLSTLFIGKWTFINLSGILNICVCDLFLLSINHSWILMWRCPLTSPNKTSLEAKNSSQQSAVG